VSEIAELADTINSMIDTLATFADQVTSVAREVGVEGKLGGQARVPGAAGTWKDLTDNVNQLAANLTTQVRAIAEVATAVTTGDLTREIAVEARGEQIAQAIGNLELARVPIAGRHRFGQDARYLFDEQWNAVGAQDDLVDDLLRKRRGITAPARPHHLLHLAAGQMRERNQRQLSDRPRRRELRPGRQRDAQARRFAGAGRIRGVKVRRH